MLFVLEVIVRRNAQNVGAGLEPAKLTLLQNFVPLRSTETEALRADFRYTSSGSLRAPQLEQHFPGPTSWPHCAQAGTGLPVSD